MLVLWKAQLRTSLLSACGWFSPQMSYLPSVTTMLRAPGLQHVQNGSPWWSLLTTDFTDDGKYILRDSVHSQFLR